MKLRHYALALMFVNLYFVSYSQDVGKYKKLPVVVKGHFADLSDNDSISVTVTLIVNTLYPDSTLKSKMVGNKPFTFSSLPISAPSSLFVSVNRITNGKKSMALYQILPLVLVEPGDTIEINKSKLAFSSTTKDKKIESIKQINDSIGKIEMKRFPKLEWLPTKSDYEFLDSLADFKLSLLGSIKNKLPPAYYHITRINILCDYQMTKLYREIRLMPKKELNKLSIPEISMPDPNFPDMTSIVNSLNNYNDKHGADLQELLKQLPQYFPYSNYRKVVLYCYYKDSCLLPNTAFDFNKYYSYLKNKFKGLLREYLVGDFIRRNSLSIPSKGAMIQDALKYIKDEAAINTLNKLYVAMDGNIAYKFSLPDLKGNMVRLDSFTNKIVVLDFWFTGCPGCVTLHPKFERVVDYFSNNSNVIFVSINADSDTSTWRKSVASGLYTSGSKPNLLNIFANRKSEFKDVPIVANYGLIGCPAMFVINGKGVIESSGYITDNGDKLIAQLNRLLKDSEK